MKKVTVERTKKHDHIQGKEIREVIYVNNFTDLTESSMLNNILNNMDAEIYNDHIQEIDRIKGLGNGEYFLDDVDYKVYVQIEDTNE